MIRRLVFRISKKQDASNFKWEYNDVQLHGNRKSVRALKILSFMVFGVRPEIIEGHYRMNERSFSILPTSAPVSVASC